MIRKSEWGKDSIFGNNKNPIKKILGLKLLFILFMSSALAMHNKAVIEFYFSLYRK